MPAVEMRMAAVGLTSRPDLLLAISAAADDKMAVNGYIEEAMEVAGASKAANIGTAIHAFTEKLDLGHELGPVPEQWMPDIQAYAQATSVLSNLFIEQFAVLDKFKIAGTPDRVVEYKGERFIADLKTGRIDHQSSYICQQEQVTAS